MSTLRSEGRQFGIADDINLTGKSGANAAEFRDETTIVAGLVFAERKNESLARFGTRSDARL